MNLLFFSALTMFINCGSVKWATRIQDTFTFGKLIALVILIVIGLIEVGSGKQKQVQLWHLNNNNNNNNNNIIIIIIINYYYFYTNVKHLKYFRNVLGNLSCQKSTVMLY